MVKAAIKKPATANFDKITAWLESHCEGAPICQVCGKNQWGVQDEIWELKAHRGGKLIAGGPIYPCFAIMCTTCGNTLFFNALFAGLMEEPE